MIMMAETLTTGMIYRSKQREREKRIEASQEATEVTTQEMGKEMDLDKQSFKLWWVPGYLAKLTGSH